MKTLQKITNGKAAGIGTFLGTLVFSTKVFAARSWPWTSILKDIQDELTGPLAKTLGILGIVVAMIGLFAGNAGDGVRKILIIILAISVVIFAPTLVSWIADSAG